MKKFGYIINPDRQIDFDRNDTRLRNHIVKVEPSVLSCISCGSCTATCSSGNFISFNIRRTHISIMRGERKNIRQELEKCMLCGKCQLVCPRGVNIRNLILVMHSSLVNSER